jgi:hypothetical protein
MSGKEIKHLVLGLEADHDYFQLTSRVKGGKRRPLVLAERLAMADSDPAFLWNLASIRLWPVSHCPPLCITLQPCEPTAFSFIPAIPMCT